MCAPDKHRARPAAASMPDKCTHPTECLVIPCDEPLVRLAIAQVLERTCHADVHVSPEERKDLCRAVCDWGDTATRMCAPALTCECTGASQ